ncbi:MAG: class II aldolase/adducin family protein [Planctomycetes bacterium]|nr:class II aldolase/adducin family protein [Planctomycetota bacterium]
MEDLAEQMCAIGQRAYGRQLVAGTEGNFSCRMPENRVLCTPTGVCKGLMRPADLCVVSLDGQQMEGTRRCSSEIPMHLRMYQSDDGVQAIVHTHPPFATTLAVLDPVDLTGVLPEGDIFLGMVPQITYQTPGTPDMATALLPLLKDHSATLLQNHGAVTWGPDLETAYILMETLEALCRIVYQARLIGQIRSIPANKRAELAELRAKLRGEA